MKNTRNLIILIIAIIVVIGGTYLYSKRNMSPVTVTNNEVATTTSEASTTMMTTSGTPAALDSSSAPRPVTPNSSWQTLSENQFHYTFKYPTDWTVSVQFVHPANDVPEEIDLVNGGYRMSFFVSKKPAMAETLTDNDVVAIAHVYGQTVYRYKNPKYDEATGQNGWFDVLVKDARGGYTPTMKYGNYYYSIYYHLPGSNTAVINYDKEVIAEADAIVSTLTFK